jgi:hypothetical protein
VSVITGCVSGILEHFKPGSARWLDPPTNLSGRAWAEISKLAKKILARAWTEMLFLVILHYKIRGRPAQARARHELSPKTKARCVPWTVMGRIFSARKTWFFSARPEPNPALKCSGLVSGLDGVQRWHEDVYWFEWKIIRPIRHESCIALVYSRGYEWMTERQLLGLWYVRS